MGMTQKSILLIMPAMNPKFCPFFMAQTKVHEIWPRFDEFSESF